jgi:colicin import membrane protein
VARLKTNAAEFVQGFGGFIQAVGPAVQAGAMPMDVVADLLTAFARNFKLGRQAEDALERLSKMRGATAPGADQAAQQQAAEAQAKQAEAQAKAQAEAQKQAMEAQKAERDFALSQRDLALREREQAFNEALQMQKLKEEEVARDQARKDALMPEREALQAAYEMQMRETATAMAALNQTLATQAEQQAQATMMQAQALSQLAQAMMAPKRVVRGADGRAVGVETAAPMGNA